MNSAVPSSTVIASASSGEPRLQNFEGSGRASSLSMLRLPCTALSTRPHAPHPFPHLRPPPPPPPPPPPAPPPRRAPAPRGGGGGPGGAGPPAPTSTPQVGCETIRS